MPVHADGRAGYAHRKWNHDREGLASAPQVHPLYAGAYAMCRQQFTDVVPTPWPSLTPPLRSPFIGVRAASRRTRLTLGGSGYAIVSSSILRRWSHRTPSSSSPSLSFSWPTAKGRARVSLSRMLARSFLFLLARLLVRLLVRAGASTVLQLNFGFFRFQLFPCALALFASLPCAESALGSAHCLLHLPNYVYMSPTTSQLRSRTA